MDIDRNGDVQTADFTIANDEGPHAALATGLISDPSVDSQIGWDGYVFNAETRQYLARNRTYDPIQGRWIERDPIGYADGMNTYLYCLSTPVICKDAMGLACTACVTFPGQAPNTDKDKCEASLGKLFGEGGNKKARCLRKLIDACDKKGNNGIDRLTEAVRGQWDGSTSTLTPKNDSQQWALDMLGNWDSIDTDLNGDETYDDANEQEDRNHDDPTDANELDQRKLIGQGCKGASMTIRLLLTMRPWGSWSVTWSTNTPIGFTERRYVTLSGDACSVDACTGDVVGLGRRTQCKPHRTPTGG